MKCCDKCNTQNSDDAKYCRFCGKSFLLENEQVNNDTYHVSPESKTSGKTDFFIKAIIIIFLLALAITVDISFEIPIGAKTAICAVLSKAIYDVYKL